MNNLHLIVSEQFPEFVQSDYPVFIEFIKAYYRWMDTIGVSEYTDLIDIDKTPEYFVQFFKKQLDVNGLTSGAIPFDIRYLKHIKEIYTSKGSEQALIYLLRVIDNAETTISYPSEQILRASDGRWNQEQFITVRSTLGTIPTQISEFFIVYPLSYQRVEVTRFEVIDDFTLRLYYRHNVDIAITVGQTIQLRDTTNTVIFLGDIVKSPSYIQVGNGGRDWTLGQVIIIPGTKKNTIARVAEIDSIGSIKRIEIIEYGFDHTESQTLVISPYPIKPLGSVYDITSEIISVSPLAYHHTLTINDYVDGVSDTVEGTASGQFKESYFLENYVESSYSGSKVFNISTDVAPTEESSYIDLTIEQWLASRASLNLRYSDKVTLKGKWADNRGQISNESIRLQDNFYYQQYSYVIDSTAKPETYIELARNIHPAGTKMFTNYSLVTNLSSEIFAETTFPFVSIDLNDATNIADEANKEVNKLLIDTLTLSDQAYINVDKYLNDSVNIVSNDSATVTQVQFDAETYFAEEYVSTEKTLDIGM